MSALWPYPISLKGLPVIPVYVSALPDTVSVTVALYDTVCQALPPFRAGVSAVDAVTADSYYKKFGFKRCWPNGQPTDGTIRKFVGPQLCQILPS